MPQDRCTLCDDPLSLPYECNRCGDSYCSDHRLPEHHECHREIDVRGGGRRRQLLAALGLVGAGVVGGVALSGGDTVAELGSAVANTTSELQETQTPFREHDRAGPFESYEWHVLPTETATPREFGSADDRPTPLTVTIAAEAAFDGIAFTHDRLRDVEDWLWTAGAPDAGGTVSIPVVQALSGPYAPHPSRQCVIIAFDGGGGTISVVEERVGSVTVTVPEGVADGLFSA